MWHETHKRMHMMNLKVCIMILYADAKATDDPLKSIYRRSIVRITRRLGI